MSKIITLDKLDINSQGKIIKIDDTLNLKRRFEDLGIINNSLIRCEFKSPFNDPKAYFIKGTTIAIRNEDARKIKVIIDE